MASDGCQIRPGQGEHVGETLDNRNNLQVTLAQQSNGLNVFLLVPRERRLPLPYWPMPGEIVRG